ncbi:hypothetical protein niasHT_018418 [Heterodera trifolii]|uniref:Uncharacterized protein n=1 Tax=Heterodera trifolii TaxID=157864 RepID=A0ABD2KWB1_9BILA
MASTVASIGLQLIIFGTVVHLSYEIWCMHTFRHVEHTFGNDIPSKLAQFKKILEIDWIRTDISRKDDHYHCADEKVNECATVTCKGADGGDVFRVTGCRNSDKYHCDKCVFDDCNSKKELEKGTPPKTTMTIHIESMPISGATGAMPTTAIGTASAKLIIAIIGIAVLLLTMLGQHNGAIF